MKTNLLLALLVPIIAIAASSDSEGTATLETAMEVLSLSFEEASAQHPVSLRGVVTAAPASWLGRFFLQDDTAGVFVNFEGIPPKPGDRVHVQGVSNPGGYAPVVENPRWEVIGREALPPARRVSIDELISGTVDCLRIEISGIVRDAWADESNNPAMILVSGAHRFEVYFPVGQITDPERYIGKEILVRGTAGTKFNSETHQLIGVIVSMAYGSDLEVLKGHPGNPYAASEIPLGYIARYHHDLDSRRRIHVQGVVVHHRPGKDIFLQDETGGLQVRIRTGPDVEPGDSVEAVGFLDIENHLPVLNDSQYRILPGHGKLPEAKKVDLGSIKAGWHHADYVKIEGTVLGILPVPVSTGTSGQEQFQLTWLVQTPEFLFIAEGPLGETASDLESIRAGSRVEFSGVALLRTQVEWDNVGTMDSLQLLIPGPDQILVLEKASWLTPERFRFVLAIITVACLLALFWIYSISRKNKTLRFLVRQKDSAQKALQKINDELDHRVGERTKQLKVEMRERKEAEVRFKAILAERTRLAQELHDTVEQNLTGISLHLDAANQQLMQSKIQSPQTLGIARKLMSRSQSELRRSIWDLRSRELEQFDLPNALKLSAERILEEKSTELGFSVIGNTCSLSEITEENLLKIGREALTNIVKHANAGSVNVRLEYGDKFITLTIVDDGQGFDKDNCLAQKDGHFGLSGMAERTRRIGGKLKVTSSPGEGACIELTVPLQPPEDNGAPSHGGPVQ